VTSLISRTALLVVAILVTLGGFVLAQERAASEVYKLVLDNERVRVFQANFKPGDKVALRNYPSHLIYTLTDGTLVFMPAGRTGYEVDFKAGEAMWFPPLARATENDSNKEVRVLLIEFKDGGVARAGKAKGRAKGKGKPKTKAAAPAKAKTSTKK
jgi:hypothetical protein